MAVAVCLLATGLAIWRFMPTRENYPHNDPVVEEPSTNAPNGLYFCTKLGTKLIYREDGEEDARIITRVVWLGNDALVTQSVVDIDGKPSSAFDTEYLVSDKGVFGISDAQRADANNEGRLARPFWVLKLPHRPGDQWVNPSSGGTRTVGPFEEIEVPAGRFRAIRVDSQSAGREGKIVVISSWHAEGVGTIKWSSGIHSRVLVSVVPGKD